MMRFTIIALASVQCLCVANWSLAQGIANDIVKIRNESGHEVYVWFWPRVTEKWGDPPLHIFNAQTLPVAFESKGLHFVVLQDSKRREVAVGDVDFHRFAKEYPDVPICLSVRYVQVPREFSYTVTVSVPETQKRTVRVQRCRQEARTQTFQVTKTRSENRSLYVSTFDPISGQTNVMEQTYTVMVPYVEQVEQTYTVAVPYSENIEQLVTVMVPQQQQRTSKRIESEMRADLIVEIDGNPIRLIDLLAK